MARDYLAIYHRLLNRPVETDRFLDVNNAATAGIGSECLSEEFLNHMNHL